MRRSPGAHATRLNYIAAARLGETQKKNHFDDSSKLSVLLIVGCGGSGVELGEVKGKVTLDGQPLPNALVRFIPEKGRSAQGITDASGEYKLDYSPDDAGALVGKSKVKITTGSLENPKGEKIPKKYNEATELTADVTSGSNTLNFELSSK